MWWADLDWMLVHDVPLATGNARGLRFQTSEQANHLMVGGPLASLRSVPIRVMTPRHPEENQMARGDQPSRRACSLPLRQTYLGPS